MISLRLAALTDAPALLDIYRPYVERTTVSFETEVPSLGEFEDRIREYSRTFPYLVAEEKGQILGYAYAHAFHERAAYHWTVETSIYVCQDHRGQHVGQRLYGALLPLLKAQGVKNVCAVVTIPNDPSMKFHEGFGFRAGAILPRFGYKHGLWCGVAYLYLSLDDDRQDAPGDLIPIWSLDPEIRREFIK